MQRCNAHHIRTCCALIWGQMGRNGSTNQYKGMLRLQFHAFQAHAKQNSPHIQSQSHIFHMNNFYLVSNHEYFQHFAWMSSQDYCQTYHVNWLCLICPQCILLYNISVCFITRVNNMFHMVSTLFSNSCLNFEPRFSYGQGLFPLTNDNVWSQHSDASFIAFLIWMSSQTACYKFHIQMCHIHPTFH